MQETQETWVWSLGPEDPLVEEMATHSSTVAWRILWTEEPGGLQSMGSQRVGHDWATNTHTHIELYGFLNIFWILTPLSDTWFASIFSHSVGCIFGRFPLLCKNFLLWCSSTCLFLLLLGSDFKKSSRPVSRSLTPTLTSRSLWFQVLHSIFNPFWVNFCVWCYYW